MGAGKKRQLNYELLRILAMLMIVCLHYLRREDCSATRQGRI